MIDGNSKMPMIEKTEEMENWLKDKNLPEYEDIED